MSKCKYDPKMQKRSVGVFDCPYCGNPVIAGYAHPNYDDDESDDYCETCEPDKYPQCNKCLGS